MKLTKAARLESSGTVRFVPEDSGSIQGRACTLEYDGGEYWYSSPTDSQQPLVPDPPAEEIPDDLICGIPLFGVVRRIFRFLFDRHCVDVQDFMDGKSGRPKKADWLADQTIDVTKAVQAAIDSRTKNYSIAFPGPHTYRFSEGRITDKTNLRIFGSGILDGTLHICNSSIPKEYPLNITIEGICWDRGRPDANSDGVVSKGVESNKNAIHLEYCSGIRILNCNFSGVDKCIFVSPHNVFQHVSRILISGCSTSRARQSLYLVAEGAFPYYYHNSAYPNYFYYVGNEKAGTPEMTMGAGDVTIVGCNPVYATVAHIWAHGADGLVVKGNTMFFPGGYYRSQAKKANIFVEYSNWLVINGNELFESGEEAILLHWATNYNINGNNIAWPGQRDAYKGFGIRITGGGIFPAGNRRSCGTIVGNGINQPTRCGIRIDSGCDILTISSNTIVNAGSTSPYYGDGTIQQGASAVPSTESIAKFGISVASDCGGIVVIGNVCPENKNDIPKTNSQPPMKTIIDVGNICIQ